jgi:anti-sigma B factor antagonist
MNPLVKIFQPSGILDGIRGHELCREINETINLGIDIVLIDLNSVQFIDSSGLGTLVSALKIVRNAGSQLFLCSVNGQIKMLFELTKMDKVFEKFADQDEFNRKILAVQH